MKKLLIGALAFLLILTGCSNGKTSLSQEEVIFKIGDEKVTTQQLYTSMLLSDGGKKAIELAQQIMTQDITNEAIQAEVDAMLQDQKDTLKDSFLTEVQKLGFVDEEDYVERSLRPFFRMKRYTENHLTENYSTFASTHLPKELRVLEIVGKDKADEVSAKLKEGVSFDTIVQEYKTEGTTHVGTQKIQFLNGSNLPAIVVKFVKEQNEPAISEVLATEGSEVKYYLVDLVENDLEKLKDQAIAASFNVSSIAEAIMADIYRGNGFRIYDINVYEMLKPDYSDFFAK